MDYSHPLFLAALLLYIVSAGLYHVPVLVGSVRGVRLARGAALTGFALHTIGIIDRSIILGHAPYVELREAVATIAWTVVLLTLLVEWRRKTSALGALALPMAVVMMFMADTLPVFGRAHPLIPSIYQNPLKAHIGAIVAAFGGFALAFCAAILYLVQERRLKEKRVVASQPGTLGLMEIEEIANSLAAFGFSMLSLGLLLGMIWASRGLWHGAWLAEPIVLATIATWCIYAAYLYLRGVRGSRGRSNMYYLIAGFSLAAITVLIIRVVLPGQHGF
ncbi:MAG TPA: cytochrome c biogenesis protein CcsA [Armatimonadota bacterium]|jgi:ABC-type transport system involved in cytochrome c biogenesis permease subunit